MRLTLHTALQLLGIIGFNDSHVTSGAVKNETFSTLGLISSTMSLMSSLQEADCYQGLLVSSSPVEGPKLIAPRLSDWEGVQGQGDNHGCFPEGLWGSVRGHGGKRGMCATHQISQTPHQFSRAVSCVFSSGPQAVPEGPKYACFGYKQTGRDTFSSSIESDLRSAKTLQSEPSVTQRSLCSRLPEQWGRSSLQRQPLGKEMEALPGRYKVQRWAVPLQPSSVLSGYQIVK